MDRKEAERLLRSKPPKKKSEKIGFTYDDKSRGDEVFTRNYKEDLVIDAIDMRRTITKFTDLTEKVMTGQLDVGNLFQGIAPDMALRLIHLALNGGSEKIQLEALRDLLDRAGYSKVQKHAIASINPDQPKEQLLALIEGLANKNKAIEIEDDNEDQKK